MVSMCIHTSLSLWKSFFKKVSGSGTQTPISPQMPTEETSGLVISPNTSREIQLRTSECRWLISCLTTLWGFKARQPTLVFTHQDRGLDGTT